MSFSPSYHQDDREFRERYGDVLEAVGKWLLGLGAVILLAGVGLTIYTYEAFATGTPPGAEAALSNLGIYYTTVVVGVLLTMIGSTMAFWGEDVLGVIQVIAAALIFFSPMILPQIFSGAMENEVTGRALQILQNGGIIFLVLALCVLFVDLGIRVRNRSLIGAKADQLQYGKGLREENDIRNVFLGKCWQLPFCRSFVRERCPIYHAKRTCWKERVGCMCEETVIQRAMEGKVIVNKDELLAAKFIPHNHRMPESQKAERCRQCVIYNERQKHKYRLFLPITIGFFVGLYVLGRPTFLSMTQSAMAGVEGAIQRALLSSDTTTGMRETLIPLDEFMLGAVFVLAFVYALKFVEYCLFKIKI